VLGLSFNNRTFLEPDLEAWQLEAWAWLMRNRGGLSRLTATRLVTPSREYFPPSDAKGADLAAHVFDQVKALMGMTDWPCELEASRRAPAATRVGEFWSLTNRRAVNGTFQVADGRAIIRYGSDLVDQPMKLVATFAHELSHYLIRAVQEPLPGGDAASELVTELTVAYVGLGVFSANVAFSFQQHGDTFSQGWRAQRNGYFSPASWSFAIAVFLALKAESPSAASRWLTRELVGPTEKAGRYLAKHPALLEPLRAIA